MARHNEFGKWGEETAVQLLIGKGYAIRERNWRMGSYEIDIIAMISNRIVFVEVKTRSSSLDEALASIDRQRMMRMVRAANLYVQTYDIPHDIQYDIITIAGTQENYQLEHIPDAFLAPMSSRR